MLAKSDILSGEGCLANEERSNERHDQPQNSHRHASILWLEAKSYGPDAILATGVSRVESTLTEFSGGTVGARFPEGVDRFLYVVVPKLCLAGLPRL